MGTIRYYQSLSGAIATVAIEDVVLTSMGRTREEAREALLGSVEFHVNAMRAWLEAQSEGG